MRKLHGGSHCLEPIAVLPCGLALPSHSPEINKDYLYFTLKGNSSLHFTEELAARPRKNAFFTKIHTLAALILKTSLTKKQNTHRPPTREQRHRILSLWISQPLLEITAFIYSWAQLKFPSVPDSCKILWPKSKFNMGGEHPQSCGLMTFSLLIHHQLFTRLLFILRLH